MKKLCTALRRNAKEERVLLHYNGHGVPLPTTNGEVRQCRISEGRRCSGHTSCCFRPPCFFPSLTDERAIREGQVWVFNKTYTQYIPLSIYDLQIWMGAPSIYVFDCSAAGLIVSSFQRFAAHHEQEQLSSDPSVGGVQVRTERITRFGSLVFVLLFFMHSTCFGSVFRPKSFFLRGMLLPFSVVCMLTVRAHRRTRRQDLLAFRIRSAFCWLLVRQKRSYQQTPIFLQICSPRA